MLKRSEARESRGIDDALLARVEEQAWFHKYPRGWPLLLFAIIAIGTIVSVIAMERADRQTREIALDRNLTEIASGLQRRASENIALLRAGAALFASRDQVSRAEFREFANGLYGRGEYHGAIGLGWAPLIPADGVPAFEEAIRNSEDSSYTVWPRPEAGRRLAAPVLDVMPLNATTRPAIGFDMYSEPERRAAMDKAMRLEQPVASGRVQLVHHEGPVRELGFVVYMPVLRTVNGRRAVSGFVYSPFRAEQFLDSAAELYRSRGVEMAIYDGRERRDRLLALRPAPGDPGASLARPITIAGRDWILRVSTKEPRFLTPLSRLTLFFGLIIALLMMYTARVITRRAAEDRHVLEWLTRQSAIRVSLTRELNHRVKNTLANVLSILSLTRRRATDLDDFADSLVSRLRALSATHDLLSQTDWTEAPIGEIVRSELAPYIEGADGHVSMSGPGISLAPNDALSLGLAIHELATNAAKYGAFSSPDGHIAVNWRHLSEELAEVHWRESGGPQVRAPAKRGFGRDLIEKIVAHELRSQVDLQFRPEGVECRLQVPVRRAGEFLMRRGRGYPA